MQSDLKEAFTLFDRDCDGVVCLPEAGSILRAVGFNPSQADLAAYAAQLDPSASNRIPLPAISALASTLPPPPSAAELEMQLTDAFRVFDKDGSGSIATAELRHIMTSLGERLTEAEADEMVKQADPEGRGQVDYAAFIKRLVAV